MSVEAVVWKDRKLTLIDQTQLPGALTRIELNTLESVFEAITALRVRGAPAIGMCAAYGVLVGLEHKRPESVPDALEVVREAQAYLTASRPTAVNLEWALDRMCARAESLALDTTSVSTFRAGLEAEAHALFEENTALCRAIGEHGAALVKDGDGILTHCNAGPLATAAEGTALAVVIRAHKHGKRVHVFADETRPLLQGARLTAWEMMQEGIDVQLICDNTAAWVMQERKVDLVVVGADRIAANGDTANKIGTYSVAVAAKHHGIPFYVAAPYSTFDMSLQSGAEIPIEHREASEITHGFGSATAPQGVPVYSPAFDVTPAELIAGLITEAGVLYPPFTESIAGAFAPACAEAGV